MEREGCRAMLEEAGLELTPRDVFEHLTVEALAAGALVLILGEQDEGCQQRAERRDKMRLIAARSAKRE